MHRNQLIFTAVFNKGQIYTGTKPDGDVYQKQAEIAVGYIQGDKREIRAGMTDNVLEDDDWHLFNIIDDDNVYYESVAILGVASVQEAQYYAQRYFAETLGVMTQCVYVGAYHHKVLKRFLDNTASIENIRIKPETMGRFIDVTLSNEPVWDDEVLLSHDGSVRALLAELVANDDNKQLLDAMDKLAFAQYVQTHQDAEQLDALFTDVVGLTKLARQLTTAMDKKGSDVVRLDKITQSDKPFKRNGMTNLALMMNMSDGQTVSVLFYNPDETPSKIQSKDTLTSWKWTLNNRDVTAALQPQTGKDVSIPTLASRIMQLVEKNHSRFVRNKVKQEKENQALTELQNTLSQKQQTLADLDAQIADMQAKVDELVKNPKTLTAAEQEPQSKQAQGEPVEPVSIVSLTESVQELDKEAYLNEYKQVIKNNVMVYCPPLKNEVELRSKTGKHILNRGDYSVKFPLLKHLPQMVKTAFDKKPMTVIGKRNIKEAYRVFTNVKIDGENKVAGMIIFKDNNNKFVYDMYVNEKNRIGKGVTLPSGVASSNDNADNPAQSYPFDKDNTQTDSLSQDVFVDDDAMLDSTGSKMVLNLFIFDEHGNEIDDLVQDEHKPTNTQAPDDQQSSSNDEQPQHIDDNTINADDGPQNIDEAPQNIDDQTQQYSPDNPFKDSDKILADRYEKRANALTQQLLDDLIAKTEKAGYVVNPTIIESPHMGVFMASKQIVDKMTYIIGYFKNHSSRDGQRNADDFKVTFLQGEPSKLKYADPGNSKEMPKYTSDIHQAIEWGNEWLESAKPSENPTDKTASTSQTVAEILVNEYGWQYNSKTSITLGRYSNDKFGEFTVSADVKDDDIVANQPLTNVFIGGVRDAVQDAKDFHRRTLDWLDSYQSKPVGKDTVSKPTQDTQSATSNQDTTAGALSQTEQQQGDELPSLIIDENASKNEIYAQVNNWLKDNLQGKTITTVDGKQVSFNRKYSIDHLSHDSRRSILASKAIGHIADVFAKGEFMGREALNKARKDKFVAFHTYEKQVDIDGKKVLLQAKAGEKADGTLQTLDTLIAYHQKVKAMMDSMELDGADNKKGHFLLCIKSMDLKGELALDENHSTMLDGLQDEFEATLTILQILDEYGQDITKMDEPQDTTEQEQNTMNNPQNPNYTQSDIDYLQSIINGTLDLETVDMDKMIEIGEKDEHDPMYEQALQIISDYLDEMSK